MLTRVPIALFNYQAGGLGPAGYDFAPLARAFADVDEPPALIIVNEANRWRENGNEGLHLAAEALSEALASPYAGEVGWCETGPIPPAMFWDPGRLTLRAWLRPDDPATHDDKRNVARFTAPAASSGRAARVEFLAIAQHWSHRDGGQRLAQARAIDRYGTAEPLPVIVAGDLNSTASGPHLPQRDWATADYRARAHKARKLPDGTWVSDTDAVDHLIGRWDPTTQRRVDGCGLHALAELAWRVDPATPVRATVNAGVDAGGGQLIDWLLVNDAMLPHTVPASYRVHVPNTRPRPSDHRLVTATLDFTRPTPQPQGEAG